MVLDHHLLNGYGSMTRITFEDGKVTMRGGKVATEEKCRCTCLPLLLNSFFIVCPEEFSGESCGWMNTWSDWLVGALNGIGYTVTQSEVDDCASACGGEQCACSSRIIATCNECGLDEGVAPCYEYQPAGPFCFPAADYANDPGWVNIMAENGGAPQPENVFGPVGPPPGEQWKFFCPDRSINMPVGENGELYIPICNPLP